MSDDRFSEFSKTIIYGEDTAKESTRNTHIEYDNDRRLTRPNISHLNGNNLLK